MDEESSTEQETIIEIKTPNGSVLHRWTTKTWEGKPSRLFFDEFEDALWDSILRDTLEPAGEPIEGYPV